MKIVADESVDYPIIERLRADNHEVVAVVEMSPSISDEEVLSLANQHEVILLTGDKDFGDLVFRDRRYTFGVILVRLSGLSPVSKAITVAEVVREHNAKLLHAFTVVSPNSVRIRQRLL